MDPESRPCSPDAETKSDQIYRRCMISLHELTVRFVELLQAEGGMLDLRYAMKVLAVDRKRRLYDITNVLESIGLVVKISKGVIQWIGALPRGNTCESNSRLKKLRSELRDLEQKERWLEQMKLWLEQSISSITEDYTNLTYVTHDDICSSFSGHTLLAIRAPSGTQIDVPIPKASLSSEAKYQMHLKSVRGPIDVLLLNKHSPSSSPIVLSVPPPEEILQKAKLAMSTGGTESSRNPCHPSADTSHCTKSRQMESHPALCCNDTEPDRMDTPFLQRLSEELKNLLDPSKEIKNACIITKLMASEVFSHLKHASTPPSEHENTTTLDDSDSRRDHFDVPALNV